MNFHYYILEGSNLLFFGRLSRNSTSFLDKVNEVVSETSDTVDVRVGAGEVWDDFVAYTVQKNLYGAVNLSLIPGEVGTSAVQNIGAYGVEAKDLIVSVDTVCVSTGNYDSSRMRNAVMHIVKVYLSKN